MKVELVEQLYQPDWRPASVRFHLMIPLAVTAALHCSEPTRLAATHLTRPTKPRKKAPLGHQCRVCGRMLPTRRLALSNATPHQNNVGE